MKLVRICSVAGIALLALPLLTPTLVQAEDELTELPLEMPSAEVLAENTIPAEAPLLAMPEGEATNWNNPDTSKPKKKKKPAPAEVAAPKPSETSEQVAAPAANTNEAAVEPKAEAAAAPAAEVSATNAPPADAAPKIEAPVAEAAPAAPAEAPAVEAAATPEAPVAAALEPASSGAVAPAADAADTAPAENAEIIIPSPELPEIQLVFGTEVQDIAPEQKPQVDSVLQKLTEKQERKVRLMSYASAREGQQSEDRRIALKRASHLRKELLARGVDRTRIIVHAMGSKTDIDPRDRIDITFIE